MRVARSPLAGSVSEAGPRRRRRVVVRSRLPGAISAAAVVIVALMIGAGFLIALHGSSAPGTGSAPPSAPAPHPSRAGFPGAPRVSPGFFTATGEYVCRRRAHNRYLPRSAGCVSSVLRVDMTGGGGADLVVLYADLGFRRRAGGWGVEGFTLEVVRPGAAIMRTSVRADPFPWITRAGNINGVPGDELVLHTDDDSSGDLYQIYTDSGGRLRRVMALGLSAGGDSADKQGFACTLSPQPRLVVRVMSLLGPTIYGRWRWTVFTLGWKPSGGAVHRISRRTFVRRGLPARSQTVAGRGCGRRTGATQTDP
jgi:hypothetical protein